MARNARLLARLVAVLGTAATVPACAGLPWAKPGDVHDVGDTRCFAESYHFADGTCGGFEGAKVPACRVSSTHRDDHAFGEWTTRWELDAELTARAQRENPAACCHRCIEYHRLPGGRPLLRDDEPVVAPLRRDARAAWARWGAAAQPPAL